MAALIDLTKCVRAETDAACDVCIIGAGAAGLYLANRLSVAGQKVIVLEAGGETCGTGESVGIVASTSGGAYRGATGGRAFGWGGSTSRWGGLLVPHSSLDLRDDATPASQAWKHVVEVVGERSNAVFSTLDLGSGGGDFFALAESRINKHDELFRDQGMRVVAAEFLPFERRNLTYLADGVGGKNVTVYLNAVASHWVCEERASNAGAITSVVASAANARKLRVSATSFVIAAGAIESARILLEIDRSAAERLLPRSAFTGRNLSDHLSCSIADVHIEDRDAAAKLFGPVFLNGRMRSFRFVEASREPSIPRHFSHFIFDIDNPGFRLAKELLFSMQTKTLPAVSVQSAVEGIGGLSKLAYHRFVRSTLFVPHATPAHFQLDVEQCPNPANRVQLGSGTDRFGRPMADVQWQVSNGDLENIRMLTGRLMRKWPDRSHGYPRLVSILADSSQPKPYDAYHPVGTCRMGLDKEATVDFELRVKGTRNLFVLSTAVLPSAGTANPTFTMLCLGDKLADALAN